MSLKLRITLVSAILTVVSSVVLPAVQAETSAQGAKPQAQLRDPLAVYKAVGINKDQETKLQTLATDFRKLAMTKGQEMDALMRDMRALFMKPDPDETAVVSKQLAVNKLNGDMSVEHMKLMVRMRKVLTPEQKKKLVGMMSGGPISVKPVSAPAKK